MEENEKSSENVSKLFPETGAETFDQKSFKDWASSKQQFTISDIQRYFFWGYNRAQSMVSNLLETGELTQILSSRGVYYRLNVQS